MPDRSYPDWNDLRPFLALVRAGSFSGAARAMGTRHSTVSRRIDALEQAIGTRLVQRSPSGAALTETGRNLLPFALGAERAIHAFMSAANSTGHTLRLALPTGLAPLLATCISAVLDQTPGLSVEVVSSSNPANLTAGEADLAVRIGPVMEADLLTQTVAQAGWSLFASPDYLAINPPNADPTDLSGHRILGLHANLAGSPPDQWLEDHSAASTTVVLRLAHMTELVATARQGVGLALLPCFLADPLEDLRRLTPDVLVRQRIALVYRRDVARDPRGRKLINGLAKALRQSAPALVGERA
jgi:DNA-binding transcriptional LysR family regulator